MLLSTLLMWAGELAASALLFGCCLAFPSKPPFPPSRSAEADRNAMRDGARRLVRIPTFWWLALCYGLCTGFFGAWGRVIA